MIILLLLVRATYMYGVVLHAHPVRGESQNQRNTTGVVATVQRKAVFIHKWRRTVAAEKKTCAKTPVKALQHSFHMLWLEKESDINT